MGTLQDWILSNFEYDALRGVILSLVVTLGLTVLLAPIMGLIKGAVRIISAAIAIFISVLVISVYAKPSPPKPNLVFESFATIIGHIQVVNNGQPVQNQKPITSVVLLGDFVNRGQMPTISKNFRLTAVIDGDQRYSGVSRIIPDNFPLSFDSGNVIHYTGMDALYNKATNPIPSGGMVSGILFFSFDMDKSIFSNHKLSFEFSYDDALGKTYTTPIGHTLTSDDGVRYLPGTSMGVEIVPPAGVAVPGAPVAPASAPPTGGSQAMPSATK